MSDAELAEARVRGEARMHGPRADSAYYDPVAGRVVVRLITGVEISFPPALAQGLEDATPEDLALIEVDVLGLGIHAPALDADIYVPALAQGILGSEKWMASLLGRKGGAVTSEAKATAARENGRKGGRPKQSDRSRSSGRVPTSK